MPKFYDDHYEDDEQEWDTIILTRTEKEKGDDKQRIIGNGVLTSSSHKELPLHRRIFLGRQQSKFTSNQLASILKISVRDYDDIENNRTVPSKACLSKLRRYIEF